MANVAWIRKELEFFKRQYELIHDCIKGEQAIKAASTKYLPMPNSNDMSVENQARYAAYLLRAVFYNTTQKTLYGLAGQVFTKDPVIELPSELEVLKTDADGTNVNLTQLAKKCILKILAYGRSGILVDYPTIEEPASKAQLEKGDIQPIIRVYNPWDIINWRTEKRGAKKVLSLVVLKETYEDPKDEFEVEILPQWRVLRLTDMGYEVSIYRQSGTRRRGLVGFEIAEGPFHPKNFNGEPIDEIMFSFVGSESNDERIDLPPLYDLAALNVAHYRNSADYEESCFFVGQPTPVFAGLSEQWVKEILKDKVVMGSRSAIPLPTGGTAELLQADPNSMPKEAMDAKEKQMVALGAKLVEEKVIERTATEANIDKSAEDSILVSSAKNVTMAFSWALEKSAQFVGASIESIKFILHTDFQISRLTAQDRAELIAEWQGEVISFTEVRDVLRKNGVATQDDSIARAEILKDRATKPDLNAQSNLNRNRATGASGN
jgi:hypothetical protein